MTRLALSAAFALVSACGTPDDGATGTDTDPDAGPAPTWSGALDPGGATLRRLTRPQLEHALRDTLGFVPVLPAQLEPDLPIGGLVAVGAAVTSISPRGVELYEQAAFDIADQVLADDAARARLVPCDDAVDFDEACAAAFVDDVGRRLWRRPLTPDELDRVVTVMEGATATLASFDEGVAFGLAVLLQSPSFLFREEVGEIGDDGVRRATAYELASRLSFLLWDSMPDDELLAAAEAGELDTEAGLRAQADRLLADPRAEDGVRALFADYLDLRRLDKLSKDPFVFPHMSATLAAAAKEQTLRDLASLVLEKDGDFRDAFTSRSTHLDRELAALYGVPAPSRTGWREVELPESIGRRGILGQASFLAALAHPVATSPTLRGKYVQERILCREVLPPPAGVNTAIPEPDASSPRLRDRLDVHLSVPACAGCHQHMDPVGFAFENFDGVGRWRTMENGVEIDASGDIDQEVTFADAWELAQVLHDHPAVPKCFVRQVWRFAQGRDAVDGEEELLSFFDESFAWSGYRVRPLLVELVASPGFRELAEPDLTGEEVSE